MSRTGFSPLAVIRAGMWGLLLFSAAAWLVIGWSVLRLEPSNRPAVAGAVILFGAATEALRACAGTRTWWLNAGLAGLFAATSVVLLLAPESGYATPLALIGWYLLVRGTVDIAVAMISRDSDRIWGLLMVVGVLEAGLGFFAASPLSRTDGLVVTIVGALGLLRAVADLVTALRIREVRAERAEVARVAAERPGGVGYAAGVTDYETEPERGRPRHRAEASSSMVLPERTALATLWGRAGPPARGVGSDRVALSRMRSGSERRPGPDESMWPGGPAAVLAAAAGGGAPAGAAAGGRATADAVAGGIGATGAVTGGIGASGATAGGIGATGATAGGIGATGATAAAGDVAPDGPGDASQDEWWRATADMDAMLALAGMTGAGVGAHLGRHDEVTPDAGEGAVTHPVAGDWWGRPAEPDGGLRILDQVEPDADLDNASMVAGARRSD